MGRGNRSALASMRTAVRNEHVVGAGGRCRIRTRVVGFEARQDIQATLIALIPPELATLLE